MKQAYSGKHIQCHNCAHQTLKNTKLISIWSIYNVPVCMVYIFTMSCRMYQEMSRHCMVQPQDFYSTQTSLCQYSSVSDMLLMVWSDHGWIKIKHKSIDHGITVCVIRSHLMSLFGHMLGAWLNSAGFNMCGKLLYFCPVDWRKYPPRHTD